MVPVYPDAINPSLVIAFTITSIASPTFPLELEKIIKRSVFVGLVVRRVVTGGFVLTDHVEVLETFLFSPASFESMPLSTVGSISAKTRV